MTFTNTMTPTERLNVLFANEAVIKSAAGAYGETGETIFNALADTVTTRAFEYDFLLAGKTCVWEAIEMAAEKIEANDNPDYYVGEGNIASAEAQTYFEEQRALQMETYSRKFN